MRFGVLERENDELKRVEAQYKMQLQRYMDENAVLEKQSRSAEHLRRRGMPHFAVHRRNFMPLFYGVPEIFLRLRKIPL